MDENMTHAEGLAQHYKELVRRGVPEDLAERLTEIAAHKMDGLLVKPAEVQK